VEGRKKGWDLSPTLFELLEKKKKSKVDMRSWPRRGGGGGGGSSDSRLIERATTERRLAA